MTAPLLTAVQVAAWLGEKPDTVRLKARQGVYPVIRLGRRLRFDRAEIEAALVAQDTWAAPQRGRRAS